MLGAPGQHDGVEIAAQIFDWNLAAYLGVGDELHALGGHLLEAAIDDVLFQFEFGNPVAKQSADAVGLFIHRNRVASAAELLLRRCEAGRAGTDDGDFLSRAKFARLWVDPALEESALHDIFFVLLDRDRRRVDAENTRRLTGRGTDAASELGEIIGGVQLANRIFPAAVIDQIVPVGNEIADGTAGLAERHAAIHAACALLAKFFFGEILVNFEPVVDPFGDGPARSKFARVIHEAGRLTQVAPAHATPAHAAPAQHAAAPIARAPRRAEPGCRRARCGSCPAHA
jgi:hypothetical protein